MIIQLKNIRAIKEADIILDGLTVIAGENGSGKSTISKLTYHLLKTSIDFDSIVDSQLRGNLQRITRTLSNLSNEFSYLTREDYSKIRNSFRKIEFHPDSLSTEENALILAIDSLQKLINNIEGVDKLTSTRMERVKAILLDLIRNSDTTLTIDEILEQLKSIILNLVEESKKIKDSRKTYILDNALTEVFYDSPIPDSFNFFEYNVPIIDRENSILTPIHSIEQVVYIDTPMIVGVDFFHPEREHWEDLNFLLSKKSVGRIASDIDSILKNKIIKGEVHVDNEIHDNSLSYIREDGKEFDLLECATGLKSFAILQVLYKNGIINEKTLLIIDEPEVHLHPQWVVEYARLIVLLNKRYGAKFLIASHHPDMISAIKYISQKEETYSHLNFYLAKKDRVDLFSYSYVHLATEIEEIFESFNIALERIDQYGSTE